MEGKWKLAHLLKKFTPQKLSLTIYGQQVEVEAVEREVFIRGFQPKVKVVVAKGTKEPIIFLCPDLTLTLACVAYCLFGLFQRQQIQSQWMPLVSPSPRRVEFCSSPPRTATVCY